MTGCSIFLGEGIDEATEKQLTEMSKHGFSGVFTSLHIPEDDKSMYLQRLQRLGSLTKKLKMFLMVDISEQALEAIGLSLMNTIALKELGITGIRMDYGVESEKIAAVSQTMTVGLNASTLSEEIVAEMQKFNANFKNMELWHNYYPRPETGLEKTAFTKKNQWLQSLGMKVIAFVPGDGTLRGPLFETLPTLEKHRQQHPLAAAIELLSETAVDEVYIGDSSIQKDTMIQFQKYFMQNIVLLRLQLFTKNYHELILVEHENRMDEARDVIRCARSRFRTIPTIEPENTVARLTGSVTLDNKNYGRYMGEFQLVKCNLPQDKKVNVVGQIMGKDKPLIPWIKAGQKYQLVEMERKE